MKVKYKVHFTLRLPSIPSEIRRAQKTRNVKMRLLLLSIIVLLLCGLVALGSEQDESTTINPITCNGVLQMYHQKCDWKECKADCIKKGYKGGCCSPCKGCVCHGKKLWNDFLRAYDPNVNVGELQ